MKGKERKGKGREGKGENLLSFDSHTREKGIEGNGTKRKGREEGKPPLFCLPHSIVL